MFNWNRFLSFFMSVAGIIGIIIMVALAGESKDYTLFLWIIPCIAVAAAGLAIID